MSNVTAIPYYPGPGATDLSKTDGGLVRVSVSPMVDFDSNGLPIRLRIMPRVYSFAGGPAFGNYWDVDLGVVYLPGHCILSIIGGAPLSPPGPVNVTLERYPENAPVLAEIPGVPCDKTAGVHWANHPGELTQLFPDAAVLVPQGATTLRFPAGATISLYTQTPPVLSRSGVVLAGDAVQRVAQFSAVWVTAPVRSIGIWGYDV